MHYIAKRKQKVILPADNDSEAYVFQLNESQQNEYMDIKEGDKVTITYTNGLPSPDNLGTIVTDIQINN